MISEQQKNKQLFFLVAMPRSGNTLFASIMNQNPEIACTGNSITLEIMKKLHHLKMTDVFINFPDHQSLDNVLDSVFDIYYKNWPQRIVIDRGPVMTPGNFEIMQKHFKRPFKCIVLLRDLMDVLASYMKWYTETPDAFPNKFNLKDDDAKLGWLMYKTGAIPKELEALKEKRLAETEGSQVLVKRSPVLEAIARYPKRITLAAGAFISVQVNFYILIGFILAYGSDPAGGGMSRDMVLAAVLVASAIQVPTQFWASSYSDRHGRRGIFMLGAALTGLAAFALFPLLDTGNFWLSVLGISAGLGCLGMMYGPQAAFFTELFSTEVRYSGASLGYQLGAIVGGAFAPTIATLLWTEYAIIWVSVYMALASVVSIISVAMLTETYKVSLSDTG